MTQKLSQALEHIARSVGTASTAELIKRAAEAARRQERLMDAMATQAVKVCEQVRRTGLSGPYCDQLPLDAALLDSLAKQVPHGGWSNPYDDVVECMLQNGEPVPVKPTVLTQHTAQRRVSLLLEEGNELVSAVRLGNLPIIAQEAIDLLYITYGTLASIGARPERPWQAVHQANMAKVRDQSGGKWVKPPGWRKPDITSIINSMR